MPDQVTLLHTSSAHCASFEALRDRVAPGVELVQHVRESWLEQARAQGVTPALAADIAALVQASDGIVICTCTTIGEAAAKAGAIRIDMPMMQEAARIGGPVLMVVALDSTRAPSRALLEQAQRDAGHDPAVRELVLSEFWPLFEAGEHEAFAACIASAVRAALPEHPDLGAVVLAQASMAGAAALLRDVSVPVLTSPELALKAALPG